MSRFARMRCPDQDAEKAADLMAEKGKAKSIASQRVPNMTATSADVGGTVDSHMSPVTAPKTNVAIGLAGSVMKATIATARIK